MSTLIIELDGPIAAGKTTLKGKLTDIAGEATLNFIDLSHHSKIEKIRALAKTALKHPRLAAQSYWHVIKTGRTYYNTTLARAKKVTICLIKEGLCQKDQISVIDEGLTKSVDPAVVLHLLPKGAKRIFVYVTASPQTRKERIAERVANTPTIKPQHAALTGMPDDLLEDTKAEKWQKLKKHKPIDIIFFKSDDAPSYEHSLCELQTKLLEQARTN